MADSTKKNPAKPRAAKKSKPAGKAGSVPKPETSSATGAEIAALRATLRQNYAYVVMAMSLLTRYRSQALSELQQLVIDPLLRDRIAFAYKAPSETGESDDDIAGFAIWASVSDEVDANIRAQIKAGSFPIRLKQDDWKSGNTNWLLDVVTTDPKMTASVIANFGNMANKDQSLHLHPIVTRLVDPKVLEQLGARRTTDQSEDA